MTRRQTSIDTRTPLRILREVRGESANDVATALGIDQAHYWRIENGKRRPRPDLANRIVKYFGNLVTRDQILFPEDYRSRKAS